MQKVYEHPEGGLASELPDDKMELVLRTETNPGEDIEVTGDHVSIAPAFNLVGQGRGPEGARESLKSVLTDHLGVYQRAGSLNKAFPAPWQESQKDAREIVALQEALQRQSSESIRFVLSDLSE